MILAIYIHVSVVLDWLSYPRCQRDIHQTVVRMVVAQQVAPLKLQDREQVHVVLFALIAGQGDLPVVPRRSVHDPAPPAALSSSQMVLPFTSPSVLPPKSPRRTDLSTPAACHTEERLCVCLAQYRGDGIAGHLSSRHFLPVLGCGIPL